ncbi:hypothetical protein GOACH_15_00650 [Gordonia aichiensis NBRC 108223]|uniref:Uncharacterized protein n=1 Tax=Gordonia aichiensis NBRC 108223 TaxID=1220583 RepID=L7KPE8_9ACTN|nr:hypothetical protein GOACH_15_00650 [Gordonia aichiensis NBRC 108223]
MQRADECLDVGAAHGVPLPVPLRLHVDLVEAKCVLIDDAIDAAIARPAKSGCLLFGAAVSHRN